MRPMPALHAAAAMPEQGVSVLTATNIEFGIIFIIDDSRLPLTMIIVSVVVLGVVVACGLGWNGTLAH